ncbi:hypothetical protein M3Y99_00205600 [Aphelenchoides fujianensis]|nr:hypothetical protein M3Y99_00205600 [Aphelenchoides fujianensis]
MDFNLNTNIAQLPFNLFHQLSVCLEKNDLWQNLFTTDQEDSAYVPEADVGASLLRLLGNRGETVKSLIQQLQLKAKIYGPLMDKPQLILHRKFLQMRSFGPKREQVVVSIVADGKQLKLECKATGFPTPQFQWMEEDNPMDGATSSCLAILRFARPLLPSRNEKDKRLQVRVHGEERLQVPRVEFDRAERSVVRLLPRARTKTFSSEVISDVVDLTKYLPDPAFSCESCSQNKMAEIYKMMNNCDLNGDPKPRPNNVQMQMETMTEEIVATDKVALIISNRTYAPNMGNLITPHCDAETLAQCLIDLKFKTVTLGDLNLEELKFIVKEYQKLLGDGVYAVFYFVGHGFEANGQCYLIPIGAPAENYGPEDCLSMDWVLSMFHGYTPALNLILLDICRKFLPNNLDAFTAYAERFRRDFKVNRNTIYGYATSGGVGAYEVRGETNGVFMSYLKHRIDQQLPVADMLQKVFRDISKDKKVREFQIPELRTNLTKPRSLLDPLVFQGHTTSYHKHTIYWQLIHELPNPVRLSFAELSLQVTMWFDFCGHFTNKVYVFSSVGDLRVDAENDDQTPAPSPNALAHVAHLVFADFLDATSPKVFADDEEGISLCVMLSNLQKIRSELKCTVELRHRDRIAEVVASKEAALGHVLITRLTDVCT